MANAALAAGAVVAVAVGMTPLDLAPTAPPARAGGAASAPAGRPAAWNPAAYAVIYQAKLRRPLFDAPPPVVAPPPAPVLPVRLSGTIVEPGNTFAMLRTATGDTRMAAPGTTVDGVEVLAVTETSATVRFAGREIILRVEAEVPQAMMPAFLATFDGQWRLARVNGTDVEVRDLGGTPAEASLVRKALRDWNAPAAAVCLALGSDMVVAARIQADGVPQSHRRAALLCLLEEQLPLDIESMTADFLPPADKGILGVAVDTAEVRTLLDPLEAAGVDVVHICPLALLALWQLCRGGPNHDYAFLRSAGAVDVFRLRDARPAAWYTLPDARREIVECVMADRLSDPPEDGSLSACLVAEGPWPGEDWGGELEFQALDRPSQPALHLAAQAAAEALRGGSAGWVNLRRDGLAMTNPWASFRRLIAVGVALTVALVLTLAGTFCWRGVQYRTAAQEAFVQQQTAYRKTHAGGAVPPALNSHLRSELARLTAVSGGSEQMPARVSAIETLRRLVAALDPSIRLRLLDVQLSPESLLLHGQTRSYSDAETVNRALVGAGFAMESPRTERTSDGGVTFTLAGGLPGAPAGKAAAKPAPATAPARRAP